MIVSLSQEVCQQAQEMDRLARMESNQASLKATFEALNRLKAVAVQLRSLVILHRERLSEHSIADTLSDMEQLAQTLQASAERLASQPHQVKEVTRLRKRAQELIDAFAKQWKLYAEEASRETLELLNLVSYLPEVKAQQEMFQTLKARLQYFMKNIPQTPTELAEFDECLRHLKQHLGNIEGVGADVRRFLANVLAGQATLGDLTEAVLQWCRQGERMQAFGISFRKSKRG